MPRRMPPAETFQGARERLLEGFKGDLHHVFEWGVNLEHKLSRLTGKDVVTSFRYDPDEEELWMSVDVDAHLAGRGMRGREPRSVGARVLARGPRREALEQAVHTLIDMNDALVLLQEIG